MHKNKYIIYSLIIGREINVTKNLPPSPPPKKKKNSYNLNKIIVLQNMLDNFWLNQNYNQNYEDNEMYNV